MIKRSRIVIADNQPNDHKAPCLLLKHELGVCEILEATDSSELLSQVETNYLDLLLLDGELLDGKAREPIPTLRDKCTRLFIAVLSDHLELTPLSVR